MKHRLWYSIFMQVREIEVKARVQNHEEVEKKLADLGCVFGKSISQTDRIFLPKGATLPTKKGVNVLRIRNQDGKLIFTLKQVVDNQLDKIEIEYGIDNEEKAVDMIKHLGFEESIAVKKTRRKCKYRDMEICLDIVEDLGSFIEVEKIADEDTKTVQDELFAFLETVGITKADQEFMGYDILLAQRQTVSV